MYSFWLVNGCGESPWAPQLPRSCWLHLRACSRKQQFLVRLVRVGIYSTKLVFDASFGGPEKGTLACNLQRESLFRHGKQGRNRRFSSTATKYCKFPHKWLVRPTSALAQVLQNPRQNTRRVPSFPKWGDPKRLLSLFLGPPKNIGLILGKKPVFPGMLGLPRYFRWERGSDVCDGMSPAGPTGVCKQSQQ